MAYKGVPHVPLTELSSVKRLRESSTFREAGVKGMKWGSKKDKEIGNHIAEAAKAAGSAGDHKSAQKLNAILKDASQRGRFGDEHFAPLLDRFDHHSARENHPKHGEAAEHITKALNTLDPEGELTLM